MIEPGGEGVDLEAGCDGRQLSLVPAARTRHLQGRDGALRLRFGDCGHSPPRRHLGHALHLAHRKCRAADDSDDFCKHIGESSWETDPQMHVSGHLHAANDSSFTLYRERARISENLVSASSTALPPLNFAPAATGGLFFSRSVFAHDLIGKPLHTFPDHALRRQFLHLLVQIRLALKADAGEDRASRYDPARRARHRGIPP